MENGDGQEVMARAFLRGSLMNRKQLTTGI